jgi:isopenicillin-N N-acyltransferase-like protein
MERRDFLKTLILSPVIIQQFTHQKNGITARYENASRDSFAYLEIAGDYREIGFQVGKYFGKNIRTVIERRDEWHQHLLELLQSREGKQKSREYLQLTQKHFPHLLEEIRGMADGSGIHFDAIWAMCIKSELAVVEEEPEGCSTIAVQNTDNIWLIHNEDGNMAYDGLMFCIKVMPPSGVSFVSLVYPGIMTGNGLSINSKGIIQTTNYIGSTESEIGIPRYILGRALLEVKDLNEAVDIVTLEPRAYPYHHNIGSLSENKYLSLETTPESWEVKESTGIYYHTNHLLFDKTATYPAEDQEYKQSSSLSRYQVIKEKLQNFTKESPVPEDFLNILSSHQNKPYSPCRHPEGDIKGMTLGTAFYDFKEGKMRLYKGNPCLAVKNQRFTDFKF